MPDDGARFFNPIITQQGLQAAFAAMDNEQSLQISHFALGDAGWTPTPEVVTLQHEVQRIAISGSRQLNNTQQHVTVLVQGEQEYWIREIGILLADGRLFALWSDPAHALAWKATKADLILSLTLDLAQLPSDRITIISNTSLNLAPATYTQYGTLRLATVAEVNAGTVDNVAITPLTLPRASSSQAGIVRLATSAEVETGSADNIALTPAANRAQADARYARQTGDYSSLRARATTKEDVGLGNVPNYICTNSVSDPSDSKLATAGAVKQAYDRANKRLVWGPMQMTGFVNSYDNPVDYLVPEGCVLVGEYSRHHSGPEDRIFRFKYRALSLE